MTARFLRCRSVELGGSELIAASGPSTAAVHWIQNSSLSAVSNRPEGAFSKGDAVTALVPLNGTKAVAKTTDGGNSWFLVTANAGIALDNLGYGGGQWFASDGGGQFQLSVDDGATWKAGPVIFPIGAGQGFLPVYGAGAARWLAFGTTLTGVDFYSYSDDGGKTWVIPGSNLSISLALVGTACLYDGTDWAFISKGTVSAKQGIFLSADGLTWSEHDFPAAELQAMTFLASGGGVYAAAGGQHLHAGASWAACAQSAPVVIPFAAGQDTFPIGLAVTSEGRIVVLGNENHAWWTLDSGASWTEDVIPWATNLGDSTTDQIAALGGNVVIAGWDFAGTGIPTLGTRVAAC